jgi:hypothetical protein
MEQITEAFLFLAVAAHLRPIELFHELVSRPRNALDLLALEIWFSKADDESLAAAVHDLHNTEDTTTLRRVLWYLSKAPRTLSAADRARIVRLAGSADEGVRGVSMRLACQLNDLSLGRDIVARGQSYRSNNPDWEQIWGTETLRQFGDGVPFDLLLQRLDPFSAGFALERRGLKDDEIHLYAKVLDEGWRRIMGASAPELRLGLPAIRARSQERLPAQIPELESEEQRQFHLRDSQASWGNPASDLSRIAEALSSGFPSIEEVNRRREEKVESLYAAWGTDALQWYGRPFSKAALRVVHRLEPQVVRNWCEPVLQQGPVSRQALVKLGSLYAFLCPVLIDLEPSLGWKLWEVLYNARSVPINFGMTEDAFVAPDGPEADKAREQVLSDANDDAKLARVAWFAERHGRGRWLKRIVSSDIAAPQLWRRARALALASFSNMPTHEFRDFVARANVARTWVGEQVSSYEHQLQRNHWARHWYELYLHVSSDEEAWGAFQMFLASVDERVELWQGAAEQTSGVTDRIRHACVNAQPILNAIARDNKRRDHLFGIKTERGEIYPFVEP